MDALAADDLHKRYGEIQALDGVSFAVREGEVFALLGPNGGCCRPKPAYLGQREGRRA